MRRVCGVLCNVEEVRDGFFDAVMCCRVFFDTVIGGVDCGCCDIVWCSRLYYRSAMVWMMSV